MQLEHFALKFEKLSKSKELKYFLGNLASEVEVSQAAQNLGVSFPAQVALFYKNFNGLRVENPPLEVLPIERLNFAFPNRIHFATFDGEHRLYFDTLQTNDAEQWDIVAEDRFCVTLTMASFWSNKIFAWVERKRVIWKENPEQEKNVCK